MCEKGGNAILTACNNYETNSKEHMAFHFLLQSAAGCNKKKHTHRKQSQPLSGSTEQAVTVYTLFPMDLQCL